MKFATKKKSGGEKEKKMNYLLFKFYDTKKVCMWQGEGGQSGAKDTKRCTRQPCNTPWFLVHDCSF